ncbi:MAG TPA: CAP domain-containing protein [Acidobacteriota bacterium]|nr:CAP domain-containing protein [Acidobacteriota bacterium]
MEAVIFCLLLVILPPCSGETIPSHFQECRVESSQTRPTSSDRDIASEFEQELIAITNRHRVLNGLQPLIYDEHLAQIARDHSRGMSIQGFISHDKPAGPLQVRMDRAGYLYKVVKENVAVAVSIHVAHRALLASSKHHENILTQEGTHIGIGIAGDQPPCNRYLYITQIFAGPREQYRPSTVRNLLTTRINDMRQQENGMMEHDPLLEEIALRSASSLSIPYSSEDLKNLLAESADEIRENGTIDLARLEMGVQLLKNPDNLKLPQANEKQYLRKYGYAVRRVLDADNQSAFLVVTLIGTARR